MIELSALRPSRAVTVRATEDPDVFKDFGSLFARRFLPIAKDTRFVQVDLAIGPFRLSLMRCPPGICERRLQQKQRAVSFKFDDLPGVKINGRALDEHSLVLVGREIAHRVFLPEPATYAAVELAETSEDRGWPDPGSDVQAWAVRQTALGQVRLVVCELVNLASQNPDRLEYPSAVEGMQHSLLDVIDLAFATAPGEPASGLATAKYVRICRLAEEYVRNQPRRSPNSTEVAAAAGVTVRTLHNAMTAVNGTSLQRFIVLHKFWSVRNALLAADPSDLVKTIALDHGFWHLGRFSKTYFSWFGETPLQTLKSSRPTVH